jgi:L-lactate dehydrogenase complex protein LldG
MSSRDKILNAVKGNQPAYAELPDIAHFKTGSNNAVDAYIDTLTTIGGKVIEVAGLDEVNSWLFSNLDQATLKVTTIEALKNAATVISPGLDPHLLEDIDHAIINAHLGVAENGAVWITEDLAVYRVLPFICQHLLVVLNAKDIVPTMHYAYDRIGDARYGYGAFIAGPSKTADIEQSLVLGAHGPRSMTVFLIR